LRGTAKEENMKKNKRLLMSFLALNVMFSANANTASSLKPTKTDRLYNNMIKNIQTGKTNKDNYKLIENILKKKNKELKDYYLQGDYIVKPEYLEWQIFFSGYYDEYNKGVDNTGENAKYHSNPEHGTNGYYDANGVYVATGRATGLIGKPYLPPQEGKEIRMGVSITLRDMTKEAINLSVGNVEVAEVTPLTMNVSPPEVKDLPSISVGTYGGITTPSISIPTVNPISIGTITASSPGTISTPVITPFEVTVPTAPTVQEPVVGEIMAPAAPATPTAPTVAAVAFNPVTPNVATPNTTTPPNLTFVPTGFGQPSGYSYNPNSTSGIFNNYDRYDSAGTTITVNNSGGSNFSGAITYYQGATPLSTAASVNISANQDAFINHVDNRDVNINGTYTVNNLNRGYGTIRFISYNPYYVQTTDKTVNFNGTLNLNGINSATCTLSAGCVLVGVEHQLLFGDGGGGTPAMLTARSTFDNKGTINITGGNQTIAIMIDSEGTQSPFRSYTKNSGTINIAGSENIGIDFGAYYNSAAISGTYTAGELAGKAITGHPNVEVQPGNINVNGSRNYGVRIQNLIGKGHGITADYYRYSLINGSNGVIRVNGDENVGISFSQYIRPDGSTDPIGNVRNLRIILNGTKGVGFLRREDYATTQADNMVLTGTHIQELDFNASASGGVLIRSDFGKIILDRNISVSTGGANNTVIQSNGTGTSVELNAGRTITLGTGTTAFTGMLASNSGAMANRGTITVNRNLSQGIAILASSSGTNSGTITVAGNTATGIYNAGTFNMTGGSITANNSGIGVYATGSAVTNLTTGTLTVSNGSAGIYANNAAVALGSGFTTTVNNGGLLFYRGGTGTLTAAGGSTAHINSGGTAFYLSGGTVASLGNLVSSGNLTLNMASGSSLVGWDSPSTVIQSSAMPTLLSVSSITNTTVNGTGYNNFLINKASVNIDNAVNLDTYAGKYYDKVDFVSSNVEVISGGSLTGTGANQIGIAQRSYNGATVASIKLINGGLISMSGSDSTGIAGDFATITNSAAGIITISGNKSTGIFSANGSLTKNSGTINVNTSGTGNSAVGIFGSNNFGLSAATYGDKKINITNEGTIKYGGTAVSDGIGIYVKNDNSSKSDAVITLNGSSNIDMSGSKSGVGIFADKALINIAGGKIKAGANITGIYAENGTEISTTGGTMDIYEKGVGIYLAGSSKYNSGTGKFVLYENGGAVFGLENGSVFTITPANIDNTTYGGGTGLSFVLGSVGKKDYTHNSAINLGAIDNATILGTKGGVITLGTASDLQSTGENVVGIGAGSIKDSSVIGAREITNSGNIKLTGAGSTGIYVKDGARALNNSAGANGLTVSNSSVGMFATGAATTAENSGNILAGTGSVGMYSAATGAGSGIFLTGGSIKSYETISGTPDEKVTGMYIKSSSNGSQSGGTIQLEGKESTGIYNEGTYALTGGIITMKSEKGVGIYATSGSTTNISSGTIGAENGSVALYADKSTINISGGTFNIGNAGLLFYNYPSAGSGRGSLYMTGSANATINSGGMAFYIEGGASSNIATELSSLVGSSGAGNKLNITMNAGSNLIRWNAPTGGSINLSSISSLSSSIANVTVSGSGYNTLSINKGELTIDENVVLAGTGNAYGGVEMSQSKVTLASGYKITGNLDGQIGIAQINPGALSDVVITNNGTVTLNGKKSTGLALDHGMITNTGTIEVTNPGITGEGSLGIFSANDTVTVNNGTINVSGIESVGIYGANDFVAGTPATYGTRTIDITHNNIIALTDSKNNYGIYLNNTAVPQSNSNLILGSGSKILMSNNTVTDRSIGITLKNSTLTNNGGIIEVGRNGVGIYAENSKITGSGGVTKLQEKSVAYTLEGNVDFNALIGNVEFNGNGSADASAIYSIGDNSGADTLSFSTGDINVSVTNGGILTVGNIGKNRVLTLNNKIEIGVPATGTITGSILGLNESKITLGSASQLFTENAMTGVSAVGASSAGGYEVTNQGSITIGKEAAGIYVSNGAEALNDSGQIKIGEKAVGMYALTSGTNNSKAVNTGTITLNGESALGLYGQSTGTGTVEIENSGTIVSAQNSLSEYYIKTLGMVLESSKITAKNSGTIDLRGNNSIGVYNKDGNFTMSSGNIYVAGEKSVGVYASTNSGGSTTINSGTVEAQGAGSIGLYAEKASGGNTTINIGNGTNIKAGNGALAFYTSLDGLNNPTGHFNVISGIATAEIGANGTAFYYKGLNNPIDIKTFLTNMFTGTGILNLKLTDSSSKMMILEPTGGGTMLLSSLGGGGTPLLPTNVTIDAGSVSDYKILQVNKGTLSINQNVDLDNVNDAYNRTDFSSSNVTLENGISMTSNVPNKTAIAQKSYTGALRGDIKLINDGGTITLTGNKSMGIITDFGEISNNAGGLIEVLGKDSIAVISANGSYTVNNGTIRIGEAGVGIYGANALDTGNLPAYGDRKIELENHGLIQGAAGSAKAYGIIADNKLLSTADSKVTLGLGSNVDMSASDGGIGVYTNTTDLSVNGIIKSGKDGVGIFAKDSIVTVNGLNMELSGSNSLGLYTTGNTSVTAGGTINVLVNGTDAVLFNFDSTGGVSGIGTNLVINGAGTGTFSLGAIKNSVFDFSNAAANVVNLGSGNAATGINAVNSAVRYGNNVTINGTMTSQTGMALDGVSSGFVAGYTNYEGVNEGLINLSGTKSVGIFGKNGARVVNTGGIAVGDNSAGIFVKDGGEIKNTGIITIGANSQGIALKNGMGIDNSSAINSTQHKAIGIYSENISGNVISSGVINLSGDKSIGIYSKGGVAQIDNQNSIIMGASSDEKDPSIGIYYDNTAGITINSNLITVGDKSLGIYNKANTGSINQTGVLTVGKGGTGIYTNGGNVNISGTMFVDDALNPGGAIKNSVGVYGNGVVNINDSTATASIGNDSFGYLLNTAGSSFTNTGGSVTLNTNGVYVHAKDSTVINNNNISLLGRENIALYTEGGSVINSGSIISTGTASDIGNIAVYNNGGSVDNYGNIQVGHSDIVSKFDPTLNKYAVGIYAVDSSVVNHSGAVIRVGKDGIGIYGGKSDGNSVIPIIKNEGRIESNEDNAQGMYIVGAEGINSGTIHLTGDNSTGIVAEGAVITNTKTGEIIMDGDNSTGVFLTSGAVLYNKGRIEINGANSVGVQKDTAGVTIAEGDNSAHIILGPSASNSNLVQQSGKGYTKPSIRNAGLIKVNDNFTIDGFNMIIEPDLTSHVAETHVDSLGENYMFVVNNTYLDVKGNLTVSASDTIIIMPTFTKGTSANIYKLENAITAGGQIKLTDGKTNIKSGSLTWEITPVDTAKGYDLYAQKIDYDNFTGGLWYEDFGRALDEKYLTPAGEYERKEIFEKIDAITNEKDFRTAMASLAGDVYANINQREYDTARAFENSLDLMANSTNNTKENVKVNVIAGKGKNKEETDGVVSYDYATTGVLALREVERTYRHTFGYSLGYMHTEYNFNDAGDSDEKADTIQLGVHNKYTVDGWKLRNDLTGRVSFRNMERSILWEKNGRSDMDASYETYSVTLDNILGKEFELNKKLSIVPYGALKAMYITRPTFSEDGLERLEVEGNDAWSVKPRAGVELKAAVPLGSQTAWKLKGTLDLAYEYELADMNEREKAKLVVVEDSYHKLSKPQDEKGTFKTRASIGVEIEDRYGIFLSGEYKLGNDDRDDYRAGVTLKAIF
jgi:hypothetical protein